MILCFWVAAAVVDDTVRLESVTTFLYNLKKTRFRVFINILVSPNNCTVGNQWVISIFQPNNRSWVCGRAELKTEFSHNFVHNKQEMLTFNRFLYCLLLPIYTDSCRLIFLGFVLCSQSATIQSHSEHKSQVPQCWKSCRNVIWTRSFRRKKYNNVWVARTTFPAISLFIRLVNR